MNDHASPWKNIFDIILRELIEVLRHINIINLQGIPHICRESYLSLIDPIWFSCDIIKDSIKYNYHGECERSFKYIKLRIWGICNLDDHTIPLITPKNMQKSLIALYTHKPLIDKILLYKFHLTRLTVHSPDKLTHPTQAKFLILIIIISLHIGPFLRSGLI